MKKLFLSMLLLITSFALFAQNEESKNASESEKKSNDEVQTIFKRGSHFGFFLAPSVKFAQVHNDLAAFPGARVGWTFDRILSMGFEAYGLAPTISLRDYPGEDRVRPLAGTAAFFLEPVIGSSKVVHLTFPMSAGVGWIGYLQDWQNPGGDAQLLEDHTFWLLEPGVGLELNVSSFMRLHGGITYRFTQDLELNNGLSGDGLKGMNTFISLKFGRF